MLKTERGVHPKKVASRLVTLVLDKSLFVNELLNNHIDEVAYEDRRFVTELVYGTIRNLSHIDFWVEQAFKKELSRIDRQVLAILRVSLYQMLFLSNRPIPSIVHEANNLAKDVAGFGAAKFVNFILREVTRQKPGKVRMFRLLDRNRDRFLCTYHSFPEWLYTVIHEKVGRSGVSDYLALANTPLGITLRVEGDSAKRDLVLAELIEKGISAEKAEYSPYGIYTDRAVNYEMIRTLGSVYIQDESSQLAVLDMDVQPGEQILDLCAAPGGKTLFLSHLAGEKGKITAVDINRHKLEKITESIISYKKHNIEVKLRDAAVFNPEWLAHFDKVLVDAPCSALGTIRRHPEVKWLRSAEDAHRMALSAGRILETGCRYVRPGGVLLFSVCTFTREETTDQVQKFITKHPEFKLEKGYYSLSDIKDQRDVFFITKLRRMH